MTAFAALAVGRPREVPPFVWQADIADFGGFSGIELADGGLRILAVSDAGYLAEGRIERDGRGRITAITGVTARAFLQNHGQTVNGFQGDAEALRLDPDGRVVVAFESYTRFARFSPPDMTPEPLNGWDRFRALWNNEAVEALAIGADGRTMALLELPEGEPVAYRSLVHEGALDWVDGPPVATDGAFQATDADFGPDGRLYVLERRLSMLTGYSTRISAYAATDTGFAPPEVVKLTRAGEFGDFEGIDVWKDASGSLIATLITDDNFMPDASTVIAEFRIDR